MDQNLHLHLAKVILSEVEKVKNKSKATQIREESILQVVKAFRKPLSSTEESEVFTFLETNLKKCSPKFQAEIQSAVMAKSTDSNTTPPLQPMPKNPTQKVNKLMTEEEEMLASFVEKCKVQKDQINDTPWESVILPPHIINAIRNNIEVGLLMYSMGFKDSFVGHLAYGIPGTGKSTCIDAIFTSLKNTKVTLWKVNPSNVCHTYLGQSEKCVAALFKEAKKLAPSLLIFEEIDSLFGEEDSRNSSGMARMRSELLDALNVKFNGFMILVSFRTIQ